MLNFARCVCVCVCERERERVTAQLRVCVCASVSERGTPLVGRTDFNENEATYNSVHYLKNNVFFYIKSYQHIVLHQIHKIMIFKKASYDPFKNVIVYIY